jgi:hypothetical protein
MLIKCVNATYGFSTVRFFHNGSAERRERKLAWKEAQIVNSLIEKGVFKAYPKDVLERFFHFMHKTKGTIYMEKYRLNKISKAAMEKEFFNATLFEFQLEGQNFLWNLTKYQELVGAVRRLRSVVKEFNWYFPSFLDERNRPVSNLLSDKGLLRMYRLTLFKRPFSPTASRIWRYMMFDREGMLRKARLVVPNHALFQVQCESAETLRSKLIQVINMNKAVSPELSLKDYSDLLEHIIPGSSGNLEHTRVPRHVLVKLSRNKIASIIRIGVRVFRVYADSFVSYSSAEYGPCSEIRFRFEISPWGLVAFNCFSYKNGERAVLQRPSVIGPIGWKRSDLQPLIENEESFDFSPPRGSVRDQLWCKITEKFYPKP